MAADAARRRGLPGRERPRSGQERAARGDGLRRSLSAARPAILASDALRLRDGPDGSGLPDQGHDLRIPARGAEARAHGSALRAARRLRRGRGRLGARPRAHASATRLLISTFGRAADVRLADVECVLIRKDPPFDAEYLYVTLMLERLRGRTLVINDPRGLRDANEKLYTLHFARAHASHAGDDGPRAHPSVRRRGRHRCDQAARRRRRQRRHRGRSKGDKNARSIVDYLTQEGARHAMVQEFLPAVRAGDKRVLLLEGDDPRRASTASRATTTCARTSTRGAGSSRAR